MCPALYLPSVSCALFFTQDVQQPQATPANATQPGVRPEVAEAVVQRMAEQQGWKKCPGPGCPYTVERTEGCNLMRCRCGERFCYACGGGYDSKSGRKCACPIKGTIRI
jgi:hypothetical protein